MTMGPAKKSQDTYNINDLIGKKGHDSDISSSDASWSNLVWSDTPDAAPQTGAISLEQAQTIFEPVVQAVQNSEAAAPMRERVMGWVDVLIQEATKGSSVDPEIIDNSVGNLYFFCEDIFQAVYDVFALPDSALEPAFRLTAEKYKSPS
jgi:hypothetical protein